MLSSVAEPLLLLNWELIKSQGGTYFRIMEAFFFFTVWVLKHIANLAWLAQR